ncbi:LLM class flavin-dependent oxidoreductase [Amycolatopsis sp. GM8]|uniref:LLM class flavin-dependent oxidoreductase n=1 Tax=Amycolatopsis sp. GM8 TaxID=2896530 RepID=UPI001F18FF69|nr:LLM class flavin-dependent oxidoreductase [Amycolatopsis sp. GM8]
MSLPLVRDLSDRAPYRKTLELLALAEEAGFDTVTIGQHHFRQGDPADPLTLLAGFITHTERLRFGTGIHILPIHHPLLVAEQVATLDQLSGGRVTLGAGIGWNQQEYRVFGADFARRGELMEEALEILKLVWEHENTAYQGKFFDFEELTVYPRPVQRPSPPLWVAGARHVAVRRAARRGDAWLCGPVQALSSVLELLPTYRSACAELGKEPEWVLRRFGWVKPTRREVEEGMLPRYVRGLVAHWRESSEVAEPRAIVRRLDEGEDVPAAEIAQDRLLWGAPDDVITQIRRFEELTGAGHVHIAFGAGIPATGVDNSFVGEFEELADMIRLYGRHVIGAY